MHWNLKPQPSPNDVLELSEELKIDLTLAKLLLQRGVDNFESAKTFFRPSLERLHDPFEMKDMERAVDRLCLAFEREENVLIYGDYDVDGTTAVALLYEFIEEFYTRVATYIPDRYQEGYGISYKGVDFAADNEVSLVIALDCGIKAHDKIAYGKDKGVDFIICDHHRPGDTLPNAVAVLDPKREDCPYPYKELSGCGIGFKLIQALQVKGFGETFELEACLDLVATSIAADIVPVTGENRILAHFGLSRINEQPRPGIRNLFQGSEKRTHTLSDVVFTVAPRINAAGRMKHGQFAVNLLTEKDPNRLVEYASEIEAFNADRKSMDREITSQALTQIKENREDENASTVVYDPDWHKGVIGIVASRLIETYYRPTLVFTKSRNKLAASARSVKGFDVYEALQACEAYIEQYGGHKYAAGLTLEPENYAGFKSKFEEVVKDTIDEGSLIPEISIDAQINLDEISPKFYRILRQFGPFGPQNRNPVFLSEGLRDNGYGRTVGQDGTHLKLSLVSGDGYNTFDAIGFNLGHKMELIRSGRSFKAVYTLESNTWQGSTRLQLNIKDLRSE